MKKVLLQHKLLALPLLLFLCIRLFSTSIRLSDTNIYFYTAWQILHGQILYKDIFFTNFPFFPYLSSLYLLSTGNNIWGYYTTTGFEIIATAVILYTIIIRSFRSKLVAITSVVLYLFSFIILATSDHQTGVFAASFFATIAYFFHQQKKYFLVGVFVGLSLMTKAYFLPIAATFGVFLLIQKEWSHLLRFVAGSVLAVVLVLLPTLILAPSQFIADVFAYSLTRGAGTNKFEVLRFFAFHDIMLFGVLVANICLLKRYRFLGIFSIFSLIFIFMYQDIYFLYLNFLIPFLILSFANIQELLNKKTNLHRFIIPSVVVIFSIVNGAVYLSHYRTFQTIPNVDRIAAEIKANKPDVLYGVNDSTPLFAYLSQTPMLNNITDTNTNIFRKKILNSDMLTKQAVQQKSILILHGAVYPEFGISEPILDEIVNRQEVINECKIWKSVPVTAEGYINRLSFFTCPK